MAEEGKKDAPEVNLAVTNSPEGSELFDVEKQDERTVTNIRAEIDETLTAEQEAEKRGISLEQWQDVLHVIENVDIPKNTEHPPNVDHNTFEYDGSGNIIVPGDLILSDNTSERLPINMKVGGSLYLNGSESLSTLSDGLEAEIVDLSGCESLDQAKTLPYLFELLLSGKIKAALLGAWDSDQIKTMLPEGLSFEDGANIIYKDESMLEDEFLAFKIEEAAMMEEDWEEE